MARSALLRLAMRLAPGAMALLVWASAVAQAAEPGPRVVYRAPFISIEARNVDLPVLLGEIGRQVGFEVVWAEMPRQPLSFEIHDATVEEVLRRLLRSEDHVIVYGNKEGTPRVDSIVLRGPHGPAEPTLATAGRDPGRNTIVPSEGAGMPAAVAEPPVT